MTPTLRAACAAIALSFAAQAGATDLWINSDSTSRDHRLGSVVLLELGTTASCIICRAAPAPMGVQAVLAKRDREPDFYASIVRKRAGSEPDLKVVKPMENTDPLESGDAKGSSDATTLNRR